MWHWGSPGPVSQWSCSDPLQPVLAPGCELCPPSSLSAACDLVCQVRPRLVLPPLLASHARTFGHRSGRRRPFLGFMPRAHVSLCGMRALPWHREADLKG